MKEPDPGIKRKFLEDWDWYKNLIRSIQLKQSDLEEGIENCEYLQYSLSQDMDIMDPEAHEEYILSRNKLSASYKKMKEERILSMKDPADTIDSRNQKRILLKDYDLKKHDEYLEMITRLSVSRGWFR